MELLVAMMVFTISLTALTLIIRFSLNFTMVQIRESLESQNTVNIMTAGFEGSPSVPIGDTGFEFGIKVLEADGSTPSSIQSVHDIRLEERILNEGRIGETAIIAFYPVP